MELITKSLLTGSRFVLQLQRVFSFPVVAYSQLPTHRHNLCTQAFQLISFPWPWPSSWPARLTLWLQLSVACANASASSAANAGNWSNAAINSVWYLYCGTARRSARWLSCNCNCLLFNEMLKMLKMRSCPSRSPWKMLWMGNGNKD